MIIIPMAGMSSRFLNAGYTKPKFMLEAHGYSLFEYSVNSFRKYFLTEKFLFIIKDDKEVELFVSSNSKKLGIKDYEIFKLGKNTRGQAETVALALYCRNASDEPITIFNIDTFRPGYTTPTFSTECDGYLEVFEGEGDNWSFVLPENESSNKVIKTTEKNPVSNLCCTGLYYFNSAKKYLEAYQSYLTLPEEMWEKGELYVAPLYNHLIRNCGDVRYNKIDRREVIFCGVPSEYDDFLKEDRDDLHL